MHKNNRFRTRIPNNTLSRLKSAHSFSRKILLLFHEINRSNTKINVFMKTNSICKIIVSGLLAAVPLMGMAQQVCGNKPWSVRMAESEMVRLPHAR